MIILGYTYITHKFLQRPWGLECRFTVQRLDGTLVDDIAMASTIDDNWVDLIAQRLASWDHPPDVVMEEVI